MFFRLWILAALLLGPQQSKSQSSPASCTVTVTDTVGAAISKARIVVYRDPLLGAATEDRSFETNSEGNSEFSVSDGFYDVCVMSGAFTPECRKIRVHRESVHVKFRLPISPAVTKEIADTF